MGIENMLMQKYKGVEIGIVEGEQIIYLNYIEVAQKNKGTGTRVMHDICKIADNTQKDILLNPDTEFGSEYGRLVEFYKRFGFELIYEDEMRRKYNKDLYKKK